MDVHEVLIRAEAELERAGWCRVWGEAPTMNGTRICLEQAVTRVLGEEGNSEPWDFTFDHPAYAALAEAMGLPVDEGLRRMDHIWDWNDHPERTEEEAHEVLDRAIEMNMPRGI